LKGNVRSPHNNDRAEALNGRSSLMSRAIVAIAGLLAVGAPAYRASAQAPVIVPIELVNNFPVLKVWVGDRPVAVMFDLGGSDEIVLTTDALGSLKVERLAETYTWLDAMGNRLESKKLRVPELRIGSLTLQGVTGHEDAEAATYRKTPGGEGYIGAALIRSFKLVVDYGRRSMTFIPNNFKDPEAYGCFGTKIQFDPEMDGEPITRVTSDLGELRFVWDTGAPRMIVRKNRVSAHGLAADGDTFKSNQFKLGSKDFGPVQLYMFDFGEPAEVDGYIGYDFFAANVVCIDMRGRSFLVRPNSG
jgi:hypothetical protein